MGIIEAVIYADGLIKPKAKRRLSPARGSANRPRIIVRWESPRNGCLREETCATIKHARARRDELARGHIVSEIWETYSPNNKAEPCRDTGAAQRKGTQ